ncbi:hypothetical protein [Streptomyces sp. NPDC020817]|uniref:hypothetical protein n=1 Tax=Streptomyces sp. NPDC020817 TaxID=3365095 RepID=UPI0037B93E25
MLLVVFFVGRRAMAGLATIFNLKTGVFLRLGLWIQSIHECAEIVRAPRIRDEHYAGIVRIPVQRIMGARGARGTTGVTSWRRRKAMREHAFRVVDALRAAEAGLDVDPKESARRIGGMLLKISTRYAEGRVGALLDESDLSAVSTQTRRFEALRLVGSVLGIAGIAVGGPLIGLSGPMAVAASVLVVAGIYRNAVFTGLGVLSFLYPVVFPGK